MIISQEYSNTLFVTHNFVLTLDNEIYTLTVERGTE